MPDTITQGTSVSCTGTGTMRPSLAVMRPDSAWTAMSLPWPRCGPKADREQ